jgi:hypothetical protein
MYSNGASEHYMTRLEQLRELLQQKSWTTSEIFRDDDPDVIPSFEIEFPPHATSGEKWAASIIDFSPLNEDEVMAHMVVEFENGHVADCGHTNFANDDIGKLVCSLHEWLIAESRTLDGMVLGDILSSQFVEHAKRVDL